MSIKPAQKKEIIEKFARKEGDVGSSEVQIAILTEHINNLSDHFSAFPKDNNSKRGFFIMIGRRKRLLSYLRKKDYNRYKSLIAELGIRR